MQCDEAYMQRSAAYTKPALARGTISMNLASADRPAVNQYDSRFHTRYGHHIPLCEFIDPAESGNAESQV